MNNLLEHSGFKRLSDIRNRALSIIYESNPKNKVSKATLEGRLFQVLHFEYSLPKLNGNLKP